MKAAFVINDLSGGGAEKALKLLTGYLNDHGVQCRVVTLQSGNDAYELDENIEHVTLGHQWINRGPGKIVGLPLQAAQLNRVLKEWQPDICVSFLPRSNVAHVMTRWFGNDLPILLTEQISIHDNYPGSGLVDRTMRSLVGRFHPHADGIFPSSSGVGDGLADLGVPRDKMHVVYNAISLADIQERADGRAPDAVFDGTPTIITVGRHAPQKDHHTLLESFAVARRRVKARLIILGQGPQRGELEILAERLGISEDVTFAGWQDNPFAWLARADLFVLSSRYEGFGNVIIEAMACGLPIISTDCPSGPAEILEDGAHGRLVPVGDVEAMAEKMIEVLSDDQLRADLSERSLRRAPDFDISVIGPRYYDLLKSFISDAVHA